MGLDTVGSSRDQTFMEAAAPLQALAPGVNAGFQVGRPIFDRRATWTVGLFTDSVGDDFGDATEDFGRAILRMTGLPIDRNVSTSRHESQLLHLGVSSYFLYAGGARCVIARARKATLRPTS
jgi:phosphate-selective porin